MSKRQTDEADEFRSLLGRGVSNVRNSTSNLSKVSKTTKIVTSLLLSLTIIVIISMIKLQTIAPKQSNALPFHSFIQKDSRIQKINHEDIIKPLVDKKSYRTFELPNTMKVMVISDLDSLQASAAVNVQVGSFADPEEQQGMAHFCEHMVFVASPKYPEVDSFQHFVSQNGGDTNAFTDVEATNYYFEIPTSGFEEALERFSHFFIDPIFKIDLMEHEVGSVNEELHRNLNSDGWRLNFLIELTSDHRNPMSKFSIGSTDSLINIPREKGIDVVQGLQDFFDKYYSANLMSLVVVDNKPLDDIEEIVRKTFSAVPNKHREKPSYSQDPFPFSGRYANKIVQYLPADPVLSLQLVFQVESSLKHPFLDPYSFLTVLLLAKGEGSLYNVLMDEGFINDIDAGRFQSTSDFDLYLIDVNLSDEGYNNIEKVTKMIFAFLDLVVKKGITRDLYSQYSYIKNYTFNYIPSESDMLTELSSIAANLHIYPPKYSLSGDTTVNAFDEGVLRQYIQQVNPENLMIYLRNPDFKEARRVKDVFESELIQLTSLGGIGSLDSASKTQESDQASAIDLKDLDLYHSLYGVRFAISDIPARFLDKLQEVSHRDYPQFKLEDISEFVPRNFELAEKPCPIKRLKCRQNYAADAVQKKPTELFKDENVQIWHQLDRSSQTPMIISNILFHSKEIQKDPAVATVAYLKTQLIREVMNEKLFEMSLAGNTIEIDPLVLKIETFTDIFPEILTEILEKYKNLHFTQEQYESARSSLISTLYFGLYDRPYANLQKYKSKLLLEFYILETEMYSELGKITFSGLKDSVKGLYSPLFAEALFIGNILDSEAEKFGKKIHETLNYEPLRQVKTIENKVLNITGQNLVFRRYNPVENANQSLILNTYQDGVITAQRYSYLFLLTNILDMEAYTYIRSEQQICYLVAAYPDRTNNILSLDILVESHNTEPHKIDEHIEIALKRTEKILEELSHEEFRTLVKSFEQTLRDESFTLHEKADMYFQHIQDQDYIFDFREKLLRYIPKLTKGGLLDYFSSLVKTPRKLSIQFYSQDVIDIPTETLPKEKQLSHTEAVIIDDIEMLEEFNRFPSLFTLDDNEEF